MIVYGDRACHAEAAALADEIAGRLAAAASTVGLDRHAGLVAALIRAGQLWQGLADAAGVDRRPDPPAPVEAAARATLAVARAVLASWDDGFADRPASAAGPAALRVALGPLLAAASAADGPLTLREPEGTAFYALYPEAVALAARSLPGRGWSVVGIRSIGTTLSAMAAAALASPVPATLRPVGPPFARRVEAADAVVARIAAGGRVAIADEGPGLSGSSFGAVADRLEAAGVAPDAIAFLPSHGGAPGPMAAPGHRARWAGALRPVVAMDALLLAAPRREQRIASWLEAFAGPLRMPLRDISGGAWRAVVEPDPGRWPAAFRAQERRKFLFDTDAGRFVARFAGLGPAGERRLALARALGTAGWAPRPLGLRHGFLVEPWIERGRPEAEPVAATIDRLSAYLGFRARYFAGEGSGATIGGLLAMTAHNLTEAGLPGAALTARWRGLEDRLQALVRPVAVDGRLHRHEWVAGRDGRVLKVDGVDHHAAHDLVGCQDAAYDVAGAAVEFGLDRAETEALREKTERRAGIAIDEGLTTVYRLAYTAFQIGRSTLAAAGEDDPAEADRHRADVARYAAALADQA